MNFQSDLIDIIEDYFSLEGISYEGSGNAANLAARYCEIRTRRIDPAPLNVHFSDEIHDSLGSLLRESDSKQREKASEAWGTVFYLRHLFVEGAPVTPYLSRSTLSSKSNDQLLWDYGIHHFHLNRKLEQSGFVERSDYLLLALVSDTDAYFVDIRPHHDPDKLLWVRQDLLAIIHSNWPELIKSFTLRGVSGDTVTDEQKKELRRKNANLVPALGPYAVAPLGGGVMSDGSSSRCRYWADKLLHEIEQHESYFYSQPPELRASLEDKGMEFKLVPLDSLEPHAELLEALEDEHCMSRDLSRMGFVVVESTTRSPIVVTIKYER